VDLAGAFDEAFGVSGTNAQEWRPGEKKGKDEEKKGKDEEKKS